MIDPSDVQLEKTPAPVSGTPQGRSPVPWLLAGLALVAGVVAIWFFLSGRAGEQPAVDEAGATAPAPLMTAHAPASVCGVTEGIALPSLDESDGIAGTLATALSMHPRVAAWLATDNLIRTFVAAVDNVANGKSPAAQLGPLRPSGVFRTTEKGGELFVDPRNYERYASIADAVDSVDVQAAARVCSALKPRLDEAYAELGGVGAFDAALERAIVALLQTPAPGADARLVPQGVAFGFEDPALEGLTPAQKHLARMGTRHARVIQDKLRQIALAIGIPRERLPQ